MLPTTDISASRIFYFVIYSILSGFLRFGGEKKLHRICELCQLCSIRCRSNIYLNFYKSVLNFLNGFNVVFWILLIYHICRKNCTRLSIRHCKIIIKSDALVGSGPEGWCPVGCRGIFCVSVHMSVCPYHPWPRASRLLGLASRVLRQASKQLGHVFKPVLGLLVW